MLIFFPESSENVLLTLQLFLLIVMLLIIIWFFDADMRWNESFFITESVCFFDPDRKRWEGAGDPPSSSSVLLCYDEI